MESVLRTKREEKENNISKHNYRDELKISNGESPVNLKIIARACVGMRRSLNGMKEHIVNVFCASDFLGRQWKFVKYVGKFTGMPSSRGSRE